MTASLRAQRGATMLVTLIMLVVLSLFLVSSMNTANTNLRVVGNMQMRNEALAVSQQAIETVLSTPQFITTPANAVPVPCGAANTLCTDVTGDGTPEYTTTLTPMPSCITIVPIKNTELNLSNTEDLGCSAGSQQNAGVAGAMTGNSLCANSVWELTARTTGANTGASVTIVQGIGVRISTDDAGTSCL
jgi:Tfp pilus assembly protein PilX